MDELRALRNDVVATFPHLAARYAGALTAWPIEQPWFSGHQVLRFDAVQATGLTLIGARGARTVVLLSGRLDRLEEMVALDPPAGIDDERVAAYAEDCDAWTAPYDSRPIPVTSAEDIVRLARRPSEAERLRLVARQVELELRAPRVARSGTETHVVRFVLCGPSLVRRRLTVKVDGALRRDDVILADNLTAFRR